MAKKRKKQLEKAKKSYSYGREDFGTPAHERIAMMQAHAQAMVKQVQKKTEEDMLRALGGAVEERLEIPTPWGKRKVYCHCDTNYSVIGTERLDHMKHEGVVIYEAMNCPKEKCAITSCWVYPDKEDEPKGA